MEGFDARKLARRLTNAGLPAVADSFQGMTGRIWGVREEGSREIHERLRDIPRDWNDLLEADKVREEAQATASRHRFSCRRAVECGTCTALAQAEESAYEYLVWLRKRLKGE